MEQTKLRTDLWRVRRPVRSAANPNAFSVSVGGGMPGYRKLVREKEGQMQAALVPDALCEDLRHVRRRLAAADPGVTAC